MGAVTSALLPAALPVYRSPSQARFGEVEGVLPARETWRAGGCHTDAATNAIASASVPRRDFILGRLEDKHG